MKRIIFIAVFFAANIFNASAYDFSAISPSGHVLYYSINGGDVTVSGGESLAGAVIIPDSVTYNGIIRAVTSIGDIAFCYCSGMTSVTIPGGVSSIGNGAFLGSGLVSVTIPDGVSIIGDNSFKFCYSLTTVSIGSGVISIGSCAFYECISLTSVIIPDNVTSIGEGAFGACDSLSYVSLGNGIISIGINAFHYCPNLTSITIPNNVATIGDGAFYNDSSLMEIRSLASVPPTLGSHVFYKRVYFGQYQAAYGEYLIDIPINVPCGSLVAYQATNGWSEFSSISEEQITINVDGGNYGSVSVNRPTCYTASITANANYGYHFTVWDDGDTNNPRIIALTQDTSFTAFFEKNNYYIVGVPDNMEKGNVIGSDTVEYLDTVVLTATSNYGYHFSRWSDNNTSNPRQIIATQNRTITAIFDYNQYTITLNVDSNILGSTYGGGSYNYLSEQTITATASYGYHFMAWNDGDTNNPRTITLTHDTIFTAQFAKNTYTITAISADTIRGSVIGSTSIEYLDSVTIMANPNYGYHFTAWNDGNTDNPRIIVATRDSVFTASFVYNQYTITLNVDSDIHGSVVGDGSYNYLSEQTITATANYGYHFTAWSDGDTNNPRTITLTQDTGFIALFAKNQYTLTLQSDDVAHGSVIGGGVFDYLDTVAIEATAVEHYHFVHWSDGNTDNPRQYVITGNNTIIATFAIDTHHVSVESCNIAFGSVEGSGDFEYGTPATVTATAYSGYQFMHWSNGDTHNPYTFAVLQDTTLVAIFEAETQGIDDVIADAVNIYTHGGQIVVETELKEEIVIYDIVGRKVDGGRNTRFDVPASGVYLVKIGTMPTQKVVVVK